MAPQAGFNAKVRINSQLFSAAEWSVDEEARDLETTNTEGTPGSLGTGIIGKESRISGVKGMRVMIRQATFDPNENVFVAPRSVVVGTFATVQIYPSGLAGFSYYLPNMLVLTSNYHGQADGLQPLSLTGKGDGVYNAPII